MRSRKFRAVDAEVGADIPQARRCEHRVNDRVRNGITIRVPRKRDFAWPFQSGEPERAFLRKGVHVRANADPRDKHGSRKRRLRALQDRASTVEIRIIWMVASGLEYRTDVSHFRLAAHLLTALFLLAGLVTMLLGYNVVFGASLGLLTAALLTLAVIRDPRKRAVR